MTPPPARTAKGRGDVPNASGLPGKWGPTVSYDIFVVERVVRKMHGKERLRVVIGMVVLLGICVLWMVEASRVLGMP